MKKLTKPKYLLLLLILPIIGALLAFRPIFLSGQKVPGDKDSLTSPTFIQGVIKYQRYYPFVRYDRNYIEWTNYSAINSFFSKIPLTTHRKLKVLHIGDSHIQSDLPTGYIRERLQEIFGFGGRGLVFPFKAAGTHGAYDYRTSCEGEWEYTRNTMKETKYEMGLVGATVHTTDSAASFKFIFRDGFIRPGFSLLKLYCRQDTSSYDIRLKATGNGEEQYINCNDISAAHPYIVIQLSKPADTLEFFINKTEKRQSSFECYGLMIENKDDRGVLYNSVGINGADYNSLLRQKLFPAQLADMNPDLVIIDLGANEVQSFGYYPVACENKLRLIIDIIHGASPSSNIIISNTQDMYYRRKTNLVQCKDFMEMTRKVATEKNCAFYDYYNVAGGGYSMNKWFNTGLAKNDKIHLSAPGYYVRGELFLNALLNSYHLSLLRTVNDSLIAEKYLLDTSALKQYFVEEINFSHELNKPEVVTVYKEPDLETEGLDRVYYRIKSGDNLGSIAERYGCSVKDIQYWNGLSGSIIIAGETLLIFKKGAGQNFVQPQKTEVKQGSTQPKPNGNIPSSSQSKRRGTYKVAAGDTLWGIAKKYGITVDAIKKANKLTSDKLSIGQTLVIP